MNISLFLHFYQPHNQQDDILNRIVNECYLPVTRGLLARPKARVIANINGALTELLSSKGYHEVIDNFARLARNGQLEFTGSAKYHAFLPLLPDEEIQRQIILNTTTNTKYFGNLYKPVGFFSPEMAVNPTVLRVVANNNYKWIAVPQLSHPQGNPSFAQLYKDKTTGMFCMFRNKGLSAAILSAECRTSQDLIRETRDLHDKDRFWFCVMDAETFGHHRIGHEQMLFDIIDNPFFNPVTVQDLLGESMNVEEVSLRPSTWTNQEQDFWLDPDKTQATESKAFILWKDPENPIHKMQWDLLDLAIKSVDWYKAKSSVNFLQSRELLDKAESSDQFWWASAKPWWSLEMIEQGGFELKTLITNLNPPASTAEQAELLYRGILDKAFEWQRTGYIRKRHLQNSGTYMKASLRDRTSSEWYNQLVLEFEKEMNDSAKRQDFEKAVKWRDAIIKIGLGTDKYDVLHVLDELWMGRNAPWAEPQVKPFLAHDWDEFSDFAKAHFRSVKTKEEFETWKSAKKAGEYTPAN